MFRSFYQVRSLDEERLAAVARLLARLDGETVDDGAPAREVSETLDEADGDGEAGAEPAPSDEPAPDEEPPEPAGAAAELLALWREHGEGFVADGFVRLVDPVRVAGDLPREAMAALLGSTAQLDQAVAVAVTALGDVVLAVPGEQGPRVVDVMGRHGVVVDLREVGHPQIVDLVGLFEGAPGRNALLRTEGYTEMVRSCGLPGLDDCLVPGTGPSDPGAPRPTARTAPLAEVWAGWAVAAQSAEEPDDAVGSGKSDVRDEAEA